MNDILKFLGLIILAIALFAATCWALMLLYNDLTPTLYGFKTITFWQAVQIYGIASILVRPGSFWSSSKK